MAAKNEEGRGYEVAFVQSPPKEVQSECPICHCVLFQPKMATCQCGSSFCSPCISQIEGKHRPCPLCGQKFKSVDNKWLQRTLNGYTVYCPNKDNGCEWTGELGQLETHLNRQESGATAEDSMKGCQFQVIQCGLCQSHRCERQLMSDHVKNECDLQCDYSFAGCDFKGPQQQLSAHTRDSVSVHLTLVTDLLKKELSQKDEKIRELTGELQRVKNSLLENNLRVRREVTDAKQDLRDHKKRMGQELTEVKRSLQVYRKVMIGIAIGGVVLAVLMACLSQWHSKSLSTEVERNLASLTSQHQHTHMLDLKRLDECHLRNSKEVFLNNSSLVYDSCCPLSKLELIEAELETLREQIDYPSFPVHLRLTNFSRLRESTRRWLSVPFYACTQQPGHGYLMRLVVYPNGTGSGNGTHVSVYLHLMNGKYDRNLSWPFQDTVKVVFNNRNDNQQVSKTFNFSSVVDVGDKVREGLMALEGLGYSRFISHSMISVDDEISFEIGYANPSKACSPPPPHLPAGEEISGLVVFIIIAICCCCMFSKAK